MTGEGKVVRVCRISFKSRHLHFNDWEMDELRPRYRRLGVEVYYAWADEEKIKAEGDLFTTTPLVVYFIRVGWEVDFSGENDALGKKAFYLLCSFVCSVVFFIFVRLFFFFFFFFLVNGGRVGIYIHTHTRTTSSVPKKSFRRDGGNFCVGREAVVCLAKRARFDRAWGDQDRVTNSGFFRRPRG